MVTIYIQDPVADIVCIGSSGHILEVVKYGIIWLELPPGTGTGTGTGLTGTTGKIQSSRYASLTIFQRLLKKSFYHPSSAVWHQVSLATGPIVGFPPHTSPFFSLPFTSSHASPQELNDDTPSSSSSLAAEWRCGRREALGLSARTNPECSFRPTSQSRT